MNDDVVFFLSRARRRWAAIPLAVALTGIVAVAVIALRHGGSETAAASDPASAAFLAALSTLTVGAVWLAWRCLHLRITITRTEVVLRNAIGSRRATFDEIAGFEVDHRGGRVKPRTLLRLTPGPHGIPRSIVVPAATPAIPGGWWVRTGMWAMFLSSRAFEGIPEPRNQARFLAEITALIGAMNAELDARRGIGHATADLLEAAHPAFRTILHDD